MKIGVPGVGREGNRHEEPSLTPEELSLLQETWYHGSPKSGVKKLHGSFLQGGRINITHSKREAQAYGKNVSEWKLKGPLKIVHLKEVADVEKAKRDWQRKGYVGYYWVDETGDGFGTVWKGGDLEKTGETVSTIQPSQRK